MVYIEKPTDSGLENSHLLLRHRLLGIACGHEQWMIFTYFRPSVLRASLLLLYVYDSALSWGAAVPTGMSRVSRRLG